MAPVSKNLQGAAFMMLSMAGFALNDALIKALAADFGLFASVFWRGLAATILLGVLTCRQGSHKWRPKGSDRRAVFLRGGAEVVTTFLFLTALLNMPLADATAILQSTPLVVTLAAAVFLGEPTGWRRYLAAAIGFAGVLLIIRPGGDAFTAYALLAVAAVFGITLRDLATRTLSATAPTLPIAFFTAALITGAGAIAMVSTEAKLPDPSTALGLTAAALALMVGYIFGISAMRAGDVGFIAPFRYSILIWALALGYIFFDERPDALTMIGSAVVVGTGIFTFARERAQERIRHDPQGSSRPISRR